MALPDDYLKYPMRRHGMDHDRYAWSMLPRRKPVEWPGGARVALWIVPTLEFFPLDQPAKPFKAPGGMVTPYPDLRHYTLRDYGNRVGAFRVFKVLDELGLKASVCFNSAVAERYPALVHEVTGRGWEVMAGGVDMGKLHYGGLDESLERAQVTQCLETLRRLSGQPVTGWMSPAKSESERTPELLAEAGIRYFCDWVNDDMPYDFATGNGGLTAMPLSAELDDQAIIFGLHHSEDDFAEQVADAFDTLHNEAEHEGGRILALTIHPWMSGQPHRIRALRSALEYVTRRQGVWSATGAEILEAWRGQQ